MAIFLDTGFYFALLSKRDKFHQRAQEILIELENRKYGIPFSSDYVLDESMTLLNIRTKGLRKDLLQKMLSLFIGSQQIAKLLIIRYEWLEKISQIQIKFTKKNKILSFTDASNIFLCELYGITNIVSFDEHYEGILTQIK